MMARRRREKNHFRGITKRISTANMPAAGGIFLMFREILYKKNTFLSALLMYFLHKTPSEVLKIPGLRRAYLDSHSNFPIFGRFS